MFFLLSFLLCCFFPIGAIFLFAVTGHWVGAILVGLYVAYGS